MPAEATPTKAARRTAEERILKKMCDEKWDRKGSERVQTTDVIQRSNECTLVSEEGKEIANRDWEG